jgi:hypothetical protein
MVLHTCYSVVTVLLQCDNSDVTMLLHKCNNGARVPLLHNVVTTVLQWCYNGVNLVLE